MLICLKCPIHLLKINFLTLFRDLCNIVFVYLFECGCNGVMYSENKVNHYTQ